MKIIAVERNYAKNNKRTDNSLLSSEPAIFMKPDSALLKGGKPFFIPDFSAAIQYEAAVVVKINKVGKNIAQRFAHRYYDEITVGIDFTAHDWRAKLQEKSCPRDICKSFDNSAVTGSFIPVKEAGDIRQLKFHLDIDGKTVQEGNTSGMIFPVDEIIAYVSRFFTLKIGDLIYTGSPIGAGIVKIGNNLRGYIGDHMLLDFFVR